MMIKKLFLALGFALISATSVMAEEAINSDAAAVIAHIEKALVDVQKSDFSAGTLKLKAARDASNAIQGHDAEVKKGLNAINQGMIQGKYGDVAKATAELNKAVEIYKSIK